jgi:cellulose biosynthesis protein BcsQ
MLEPNRLLAEHDLFPTYEIAPGSVNDQTVHKVQTILHLNREADKRLAIVPNSIAAAKYGTLNAAQHGQLFQNFQNAIQKLSLEYDMIVLDCNPSTTLLSELALHAATDVLVPLKADKYTSDGLENIDELLTNFFKIEFVHGEGRDTKQLWTMVNFADLAHINMPNEQRSLGRGAEAELLRDILNPLKAGTSLGAFKVALLETRIPETGYLRSKPIETVRLDPESPPSRSLRRFFSHARARPLANAFDALAREIRTKTRSLPKMVSV